MFRVLYLMGLVLVAGCSSSLDRAQFTDFVPMDGGFQYVARSGAYYPLNSADAEATRMEWLETYLTDNGICPDGYTLIDRKAVLINDWIGEVHKIYYQGECK